MAEPMLSTSDGEYLCEMAARDQEGWVVRRQWLLDFAARVKNTVEELNRLRAEIASMKPVVTDPY